MGESYQEYLSDEEFERKQKTDAFRQWILTQAEEGYHLYESEKDPNVIVIETDYCYGEVSFYPMEIIQLSVLNKVTDSNVFYLHFQMHTQEHAQGLFQEMLETIRELTVKPVIKILLSCSSGMTTGFFAEKLNETAQQQSLGYSFSAVSYRELYQIGHQYDLILLAPQISYIYEKAKKILHTTIVQQIPARVFASYDVQQVLTDVKKYLTPPEEKPAAEKASAIHPLPLKQPVRTGHKVLTIALIREDKNKFHFASRLYHTDNSIIFDEDIIKNRLSLSDLYDICDTAFARHPDISLVGIAMPGIINHGRLTLTGLGLSDTDVIGSLTLKYGRKFILDNDANSIAVGYFATQDRYDSLSLLFQPFAGSSGGVGSIHKGHLIEGRAHVAGEVQYLPFYRYSDINTWKTPEGTVKLAALTLVSIICILGPDALLLHCHLIVQLDEILKELEALIPQKYIPEIIMIDNLREYMLTGQLILCSQTEPE